MIFAEPQLQQWSAARSDEQHASLKQAAQSHQLDADTVKLLFDTQCPVGPVGTNWEAEPEYDWSWPESVRTFVATQQ
jgi:hypothetical protein